MSRVRLALEITLWVLSPFLFRGLPGKLYGLDASALRDEEGRPIIPADQIRGVLRDAMEDLAAAGAGVTPKDILDLFGRQSDGEGVDGGRNVPIRGDLILSDLTACGIAADGSATLGRPWAANAAAEATRIEIDDDTGAVDEGKMQVLELAAKYGAAVCFRGEALLFVEANDADLWEKRLRQAVDLVGSIGAAKTSGFGEVAAKSVRRLSETALAVPAAANSAGGSLRYRVTFDRPILVDAAIIAGNAVAGAAVVPGGVLKGALAQKLFRAGEKPESGSFANALATLSISHAFPETDAHKGHPGMLPLPLSLVAAKLKDAKGPTFGDALLADDGKGVQIDGNPALFAGDWKESWHGIAGGLYAPPCSEPPLLARTHTAINHDGVATDQALFTTLSRGVLRKAGSGKWELRTWIVDVDPRGVADKALAGQLIALLQGGLDGISKTGASAAFARVGETPASKPAPILAKPSEYAVVLLTPAFLTDGKALADASGWRQTPHHAYEAYWRTALGADAKLESFFASQRFTGGYLARRTRAYGTDQNYYPFLLTEAGSVFRLSGVDLVKLEALCRSGLPAACVDGKPATWRNCPYVPENGYGRIRADHLSTPAQKALADRVTHV